ncbi:MAG: hypothetical protein ABJE95_33845 [Byssovorax sp.]
MKTIANLADLVTLASTTAEDLNQHHVRVLALFLAASSNGKVEWQANGTPVVLVACGGNECFVSVGEVRLPTGTIETLFETVKMLSAVRRVFPVQTIAKLADLATLGRVTVEDLNKHYVRVLALFLAASGNGTVEWQANGTTVALVSGDGNEYSVAVDGVPRAEGTIESLFTTVKQLSAALEVPPSPTARAYDQFGFWADVQDGQLVQYVTFSDGSWDADPIGIEFACQHMLDRVNADFGTDFTMDEFQEGDCNCES